MLSPLIEKVRAAQQEKQKRKATSGYWITCPSCGKSVVKKEALKKGCFVCGWRGETPSIPRAETPLLSYKMTCPGCGRRVVRDALERTGCYLCGFKPT